MIEGIKGFNRSNMNVFSELINFKGDIKMEVNLNYKSLVEALQYNSNNGNNGITFINGKNNDCFLSYKEIYFRALEILNNLQNKGINPGDELIFQIQDNKSFLLNFWACMIGGIVPVPVSVGNNDEHKLKIFKIWNILEKPYLITDNKTLDSLKSFGEENKLSVIEEIVNKTLFVEELLNPTKHGKVFNSKLDDTAFIQFSSGSTGDPKGIVLTHENLLVNIYAMLDSIKYQENDSFLSWMPLTHDMGMIGFHLTPCICNENQFIMPTSLFIRTPTLWMNKVNDYRTTITSSPNFGIKYFLTRFKPRDAEGWDLSSVRLIANGAEPILSKLCNEFLDTMASYGLKRTAMYPLYGLAEATVAVAASSPGKEFIAVTVERDSVNLGEPIKESIRSNNTIDFVDVGYPVKDCYLRIVDGDNNLVDENIVGHIQIKGKNVTKGYYNNLEATKKVICDGWLDTGDLGFMREGRLVITGRAKDIIFVNGQNYYPHDIERIAQDVEGIKLGSIASCCVLNKNTQNEDIVLFVLFRKKVEDFIPLVKELKEHISEQMGLTISNVVPIRKIPKTTSGKTQRYKLRKMYQNGEFDSIIEEINKLLRDEIQERSIDEPRNEIEEKLVKIWREVFDLEKIGINDSFFALGGNSLKALQMISIIHRELNVEVPVGKVFDNPTIEQIGKYIGNSQEAIYSPIEPVAVGEVYELSSAQKRLFALNQLGKEETNYNIPYAMMIEGKLEKNKVEEAFRKLVERHEAFRTSFESQNKERVQRIHRKVEFNVDYTEISGDREEVIKETVEGFIKPFDLSKAPLLRVKLLRIKEEKHILMLDMHHIISDGLSMKIIMDEFARLYKGEALEELRIQYKDYSAWQKKLLASEKMKDKEEYWTKVFKDEIPVLNMPTDYPRPTLQSFEGASILFKIDKKLLEKIRKIGNDNGATLYMTLLSAYNILLSRYGGQEDIIVGSPIAGRPHTDLQNIVGMFVNTLAMRNYPKSEKTFKEFLQDVKKKALGAYENQDYQFDDLVEKLGIERDLSRNPLFDITFALQNIDTKGVKIDNLKIRPYEFENKVSKFDINLEVTTMGEEISCNLEYCTKLFKRETMEGLAQHFINILREVTENPEIKLSEIEMLSEKEKHRLLYDLNDSKAKYPKNKTIHQLFEEQVEKTPDNIAVVYEDKTLTYKELNNRANRIAKLLREKGVGRDSIVGMMLERTPKMIEGALGVLKAGGTYLPIDPLYPQSRVVSMLNDSKTFMLLTTEDVVDSFSFNALHDMGEDSTVEVSTNCSRTPIKDFDGLPIPDRTLVDYEKYSPYIGQAMVKNAISIQATRGCPYNCAYCHRIWPKNHVVRSAENIFKEVQLYYNIGVRRFAFIDDIFNLDIKNSSEFFKMIVKSGMKIQMFFPNGLRGDILTKEYIDLMVEAGTVNVAFALETASPRLQKLIGKNLNIQRLRENIEYITEKHPHVIMELFTMHGFPTETEEEALMTLDFIKSIKWLHFPYVHILKIYPDTDMAKIAIENGVSEADIQKSVGLAYHELPDTLPFEKSFTLKYQGEFLDDYFLSRERLLKVLPLQMKVLTEDELVQKYNSYLPTEINSFKDLLEFANIDYNELEEIEFLSNDYGFVPDINQKLREYFPEKQHDKGALRVLMLDLSQFFSSESSNMLYDVVEPPLGPMYLLTYLNEKFQRKIHGKIAKSRIDFDSFEELKILIQEFKPDVIGIRTLTYYRDFFHKAAAVIRQWGIDVPIIAGGPYGTSSYRTILKDKNLDMVILGEGEITFSEVVERMIENGNKLPRQEVLKSIPGIAFVEKQEKSKVFNRDIILLDRLREDTQDENFDVLENINKPSDLAYIIYTSGSTGKSKGAMIEHRNVVRLLLNDKFQFDFNENDIWTMFHSFCFDFSVWEMYGALLYGGKLVMVPKPIAQDSMEFLKLLKKERVTVLNQTPIAFLNLVNEEIKYEDKDLCIRYVIFGGDVLKPMTLKPWKEKYPSTKLINMFGITETTVHCTYKELTDYEINHNLSNIGKPIPTQTLYIMNKHMKLQPKGVPGEIVVGGDGVGRGYLNRPELTKEKFVKNPYSPDETLYRSGDLGKLISGGEYEYLGRIDYQVKIRGYRIELGEIENQLLKNTAIKEAVVIDREDEEGNKYLCAYFVCDIEMTVGDLREYLAKELPDYMIPSYFVQIESMPLTSNGKVDKKALPEPDGDINTGVKYVPPRNEIEEKLVEAWREVLGVEKVGIDDDFFTLGGNSLKAIHILSIIHKELNVEESVNEVFTNSTIRQMAEYIGKSKESIYSSIQPAEEREVYKASSAQRGLYALDPFGNEKIKYNVPYVLIVKGEIDKGKVEEVFRKLVERHETFRTSFEVKDEEIVQRIHKEVELNVEYFERNESGEEVIKKLVEDFIKPFDLSKAPLLRVKLVRLEVEKYILMFDMHHIISDGTSMEIIMDEFVKLYKGEALEELKIQYKDYSVWQDELLSSEAIKDKEEYWMKVFSENIPVLNMPTDYPRPALQSFQGESISFKIDQELSEKIKRVGNDSGATLYMTLLSAYNILLSKYSGQEDIIVGSPIAGRQHADFQNIVGMFVNILAMRNYPHRDKTFREFLQEVKRNALDAYENQDYQFDELVEKLNTGRDLSRNPVFDTTFALHNTHAREIELDDLRFENYRFENKISKFDITLSAVDLGEEIGFYLEYCIRLFKRETIERIIGHFINILREVVENPEIKLSEIDMLLEDEKSKILVDFNGTKAEYQKNKTIYELFQEQVERTPDNIALVHENKELTYRQLNEKANSFARVLRSKGVGPNSIVGIMTEGSLEMIVGIIGVLKAGGAYLPIDPEYPQDRIEYMLQDSNAQILLTQNHLLDKVRFQGIVIDVEDQLLYEGDKDNVTKINKANDLAYVIYTSGSTGKPKGVMVEHGSIANTILWRRNEYKQTWEDYIIILFSFAFDGFVTSFFTPITSGAKIRLLNREKAKDSKAISAKILPEGITQFIATPSLYMAILENISTAQIQNLKLVTLAGEKLTSDVIKKSKEIFPRTEIVNEYGPTENSVVATIMRNINLERPASIGKPISNTEIYIVGDNNKLQPLGVTGELCISGDGLARGYMNEPELTEERFIANPFDPSKRMYRTGDLARWLPDGNIEFIGRIDHQVKIRGYRIELGEIEGQLLKNEVIKEAVVIAKEDEEGNKYLCAYIVCEYNTGVSELREYLSRELPEYMIPSYFIQMDKMPLTSNGKIDRKALPETDGNINTGEKYIAPRNEIEEKLVKIWSKLLKSKEISIDNDFFDLGGHSLKVTKLIAEINKEFNVEMSFTEVFDKPTIRDMAAYIVRAKESIYSSIKQVEEREVYKVSSAQKRLFALNQFAQEEINYNIPALMVVKGKLEKERVEEAFKQLVERHEAFRTSFELQDDEIVQRIHRDPNFKVEYMEINEAAAKAIKEIIEGFIKPFDLSKAPLLRVKLLRIGEEEHILMVDMHHIISDGESKDIIVEEFTKLYKGEALEEFKIQYKDYAAWQNELLNSEDMRNNEEYWTKIFSDEIPVLNMPTDYSRPNIQSFEGDNILFKLDKGLTEKVRDIGSDSGATLYMILLAAYNVLLSRYSGQEDIIVGLPVAGRPHADLHSIVGMFVNTLAMRNYPKGDKTFKEFLEDVKENALSAYEHQDYQFEELVEKLDIRRDLSRNALFDTMFVLQNPDAKEIDIENLKFELYKFENRISKFDLTLLATENFDEIGFNLEYCTSLFKRETVERIAKHFVSILREVAENPEIRLSEIEMLSKEEKRDTLVVFNDTKVEYPGDKTIYELFQEQVENTPDNIAVVHENKELNYRQLNERANSLARILRKKGVDTHSIVGIMAERSVEMIVGIMGILKAGAAYLPIDSEYPQERIEYMLKDSNVNILLVQGKPMDRFDGILMDLDNPELYEEVKTNLDKVSMPRDIAYVIYTSGSTGNPKGVMVTNQGLVNYIWWAKKVYVKGEKVDFPLYSSISFDLTVTSIYPPLITGNKIVVYDDEDKSTLVKRIIEEDGADIIKLTPTHLNLLRDLDLSKTQVKRFIVGGEDLKADLARKIHESSKGRIEIYNEYGPTETVVGCMIYKYNPEKNTVGSVPIGAPADNAAIYILDKYLNPVPVGTSGEIYIAGDGLARGYLNNEELTQEKFIENPFIPGEKMYRTGDLARRREDGNIEYVGRIDHQVKIRGYRIELGEIEGQLLKHEEIKEAVVVDKEDEERNKYLAAYIVCGREMTSPELRGYLLKTLPSYMIPSYFVQMEKLPLTPTGKIDRKALPEPDGGINTGVEYIESRNEIEEKLVKVWREVLGVETIGIDDDFFALGGDSIKAIQVTSRLTRYKLTLTVSDLFANPTIRELSTCIKQEEKNIDQGTIEGKVELTAIQKWFFEQSFINMHHWNQSIMLHSKEGFDEELIKKVFSKIVEHHDALRIVIENQGDDLVQYNRGIEDKLFNLSVIDLENKESYQEEIEKEAMKIQAGIDLSHGPLVKLGLFKTKDGDHLLMVIHHLVMDGISWRIFLEDFATGYSQAISKQEIELPLKTHSLKEWSENIQKYAVGSELLEEVKYWKNLENTKAGKLPKGYRTTSNKVSDSTNIEMRISKEDTDKLLRDTNKAYNTEINDILLAALGLTIKEWTGENKVLVNLEGHGREDIIPNMDITRTIGWFTSTYPVILECENSSDTGYYIKSIKEGLRKIPNKGVGYNILKYITPKEYIKDLEFKLNPEISFNYLGQFDNDLNQDVFNISSISTGDDISKKSQRVYDINIGGVIINGELTLTFEYNKAEYNQTTIIKLGERYKEILLDIIQHCTQKEETEMTPSDFDYKEISMEELEYIKTTIDIQ